MESTRAVTILVAFDAGARTERPAENGMAHFLEHLVFKGGEKYPTYRDVNDAAERNGSVENTVAEIAITGTVAVMIRFQFTFMKCAPRPLQPDDFTSLRRLPDDIQKAHADQ